MTGLERLFKLLQLAPKREIAVSLYQPDTFGTVTSSQRYHIIGAIDGFGKDAPGQPGSPDNLLA